jgi:hypothetical protein
MLNQPPIRSDRLPLQDDYHQMLASDIAIFFAQRRMFSVQHQMFLDCDRMLNGYSSMILACDRTLLNHEIKIFVLDTILRRHRCNSIVLHNNNMLQYENNSVVEVDIERIIALRESSC